VEEIRWLVARRAEALHRDPDEATTPPVRPSSTTDAVSISAPDVRTGSHQAFNALERTFRPQGVAATLVLGPAFGTGKVMAELLSAYRVGPAVGAGKVMANLLSAYRVGPACGAGRMLERTFGAGRMLERTFDTGKVVRSFDAGRVLRQSFGTQRVAANLVSIDRVLERRFDFGKALERSFDTGNVLRSFDTRKVLGPGVGAGKVMAELLSAYRVGPGVGAGLVRVGREPTSASPLMPTSPHGPIPAPADPGWLYRLLNDEEWFRAAAPLLAASSGTCIILGLLLVALVDPGVKVAVEILSDEASIAAFIVAVMTLMICQRK